MTITAAEPWLGAHESTAGGLETAFQRIRQVGGAALQIFTRNQRQWQAKPVSPREGAAFAAAWEAWGPYPVASHASYLINLGSADEALWRRSVAALASEIERCRVLNVPWVVLHPGARGESGLDEALARTARGLDKALDLADTEAPHTGRKPAVLLENTAGQGSGLGRSFEELAVILALSERGDRLAVCLDTCHAFAAGYELRSPEGYAATMDALEATIGVSRVKVLHLNDSKHTLGSGKDRHEHIGQGGIGLEGFANVMNDPRWHGRPMVIETPKDKDLAQDVLDLKALRGLLRSVPARVRGDRR